MEPCRALRGGQRLVIEEGRQLIIRRGKPRGAIKLALQQQGLAPQLLEEMRRERE